MTDNDKIRKAEQLIEQAKALLKNEKIKQAEQLIEQANALLNEVKASKENEEEDVIAKYKNNYCLDKKYYLDSYSVVDHCFSDRSFDETENPYQHYLTEELAEQAKKLKDFNDKLLAFKYCYDLDYKPDWSDCYEDKYYVFYSNKTQKYDVDSVTTWDVHIIYFSTEEVAQKCADWLNLLSE